MKLLITGGSSYLGQHLVPLAAASHTTQYTYFSADPLGFGVALDLRNADAVLRLVDAFQPDALIHLAGSNRTPDMETVIIDGARNAARAAARANAKLVHLSSDVIFDGNGAPYDESAEPMPVHAYGRAKAAAEQIVAGYDKHVIVRTSLIYSLRLIDNGTSWMKAAIEAGEPPTLFSNHYRNPIHADDLSMACIELASNDVRGVINVVGEQTVTRAAFARRLLAYWGVSAETAIVAPDTTNRFPRDLTMTLDRARAELNTKLRGVNDVFAAL